MTTRPKTVTITIECPVELGTTSDRVPTVKVATLSNEEIVHRLERGHYDVMYRRARNKSQSSDAKAYRELKALGKL